MSLTKQLNLTEKSVSPKRRALIKGSAAAVPAVITLHSGSAFAATSFTCEDKFRDAGVTPPTITDPGADTHFRVETECGQATPGTVTDGIFTAAGTPSFEVFKDPDPNANQWFPEIENTATGTPLIQSDNDPLILSDSTMQYQLTDVKLCAVLQQKDANGDIISTGIAPEGSIDLPPSCYNSLHPNATT